MIGVAIGESAAGILLSLLLPLINEYPHILALYPIMAAARGNIYASLGSRVTSRLHLGLFSAEKPLEIVERETPRVLLQSMLSALISATVALTALAAAEARPVSPIEVYGTALLTPVILTPLLVTLTVYAATWGFKRGSDPDEYLTPLTTLASDLTVLPAVTIAAIMASKLGVLSVTPLMLTPLLAARLTREDRRVLAENMGAILLGSGIEFVRSYALVSYLEFLNRHPYILAVLPTFNAENGAALGVLSSRLATKLHLGLFTASPRRVIHEALTAYTSSLAAYATTTALAAAALGSLQAAPLLLLAMAASGAIVVISMSFVAHVLAFIGFQRGLDPDNILIPLVTTMTDALGTLTLLAVASLFFA